MDVRYPDLSPPELSIPGLDRYEQLEEDESVEDEIMWGMFSSLIPGRKYFHLQRHVFKNKIFCFI